MRGEIRLIKFPERQARRDRNQNEGRGREQKKGEA